MRKSLIIAVLCFCFCGSMAFADNALIKEKNAAVTATSLDSAAGNPDPIGDIVNMINKLDAWIQRNIW